MTRLTLLVLSLLAGGSGKTALISTDERKDDYASSVLTVNDHWELLITPGPTVISLLGSLLVTASMQKTDFSLEDAAPKGGFKYMKFPESFQGTLIQITNEGWDAFNVAQENMDKVQLYMQQVPTEVENAMRVVSMGNTKLIDILLPKPMHHITEMTNACVTLANSTHSAFVHVMELIGEVMAATTTSQGLETQKLKDVKLQLNTSIAMENAMKKYGDQLKEQTKKFQQDAQKYQDDYADALNKIPTGWKEIGQEVVRGLSNAVFGLVNKLINTIPSFPFGPSSGASSGANHSDSINILQSVDQVKIESCMERYSKLLGGVKDKLDAIRKSKTVTTGNDPAAAAESLAVATKTLIDGISGISDSVKYATDAKQSLKSGLAVFGEIKKAFANPTAGFPSDDVMSKIDSKLSDLLLAIQPMAIASTMTNSPSSSDSLGSGGSNQQMKIRGKYDMMESAQKRADESMKELGEYNKEMAQLMGKISSLQFDKVDYETIIEIMRQGIGMLGKIREQWGKLVSFFTIVADHAEVALTMSVKNFMDSLDTAVQEAGVLTGDTKTQLLDYIADQTKPIDTTTYFLFTLSRTYVDVSQRFMTNRLAGLGTMLSLTPEQQKQALAKLSVDAKQVTETITSIAAKRKQQAKAVIDEEVARVKRIVDGYGPISPEDEKAITEGRKMANL